MSSIHEAVGFIGNQAAALQDQVQTLHSQWQSERVQQLLKAGDARSEYIAQSVRALVRSKEGEGSDRDANDAKVVAGGVLPDMVGTAEDWQAAAQRSD